jgi:hypothetical protein
MLFRIAVDSLKGDIILQHTLVGLTLCYVAGRTLKRTEAEEELSWADLV